MHLMRLVWYKKGEIVYMKYSHRERRNNIVSILHSGISVADRTLSLHLNKVPLWVSISKCHNNTRTPVSPKRTQKLIARTLKQLLVTGKQ